MMKYRNNKDALEDIFVKSLIFIGGTEAGYVIGADKLEYIGYGALAIVAGAIIDYMYRERTIPD